MGNTVSAWIQEALWLRKDLKLVMVGLDAAGKTTILYKLKIGELVHTIPTLATPHLPYQPDHRGFNVESVKFHNVNLTIWDIGGQDKIRALWRYYYSNCNGVIFVVDASDRDRISEAREELAVLLKSEELRNAAILVYANKQDIPNAMSPAEIAGELGLHDVRLQPWYVQGACATTADGLDYGGSPIPRMYLANSRLALADKGVEKEELRKGQ